MAGHSVPIDLRVTPSTISTSSDRLQLLKTLAALIEPYSGALTEVANIPLPGDNYQVMYAAQNGNTFSIKLYANGLVSGTFEHYTQDINKQLISVDEAIRLEEKIVKVCGAFSAKVLAAIKRAPPINVYYCTSDDRILEYDIDRVVFSKKSPHQKVEIVHSKSFGNILMLDNLQNLAESDLPYTHGLMNKGLDCYTGKTVLILGGGDGALMHELLKENPEHVLMIDIDDVVIQSCREHMRSVCGDAMDSYKGKNYETIVDDALVHLKEFIKEGREFDYVFADLTDVPISPEPVGDVWDFLGLVMDLGTKVLKPSTGRYMTHAIGVQCKGALTMFEKKLRAVEVGVHGVTMTSHFVPSFMEKWCFFQATRAPRST